MKFKVWDSKDKNFLDDPYKGFIASDGKLWEQVYGELDVADKRYIPVFSTGQKDIEHTEIWEGDLIKKEAFTHLHLVIFEDGAWRFTCYFWGIYCNPVLESRKIKKR